MFSLLKERSVADSNCRRSFCRALPSLSANRPFCGLQNYIFLVKNKILSVVFVKFLNPPFPPHSLPLYSPAADVSSGF